MLRVDGKAGNAVTIPPQLNNAWARIERADHDFVELQKVIDVFVFNYLKRMLQGRNPTTGKYEIKLNRPDDNLMSGAPQVIAVQMIENIRSALDYVVFELSKLNCPNLRNEREPQFVISDTEAGFDKAAKSRLRHLAPKQVEFVKSLQPFSGNFVMGVLRDATNMSKHRSLLEVEDITGVDIYIVSPKDKGKYKGAWLLREEEDVVYFARRCEQRALLMGKYKAIPILKAMAEQAGEIVLSSRIFFPESVS